MATMTKTYSYEAIDGAGAVVKGTITSDSPDAVVKALTSKRLVPLEIKGAGTGMQRDVKIPGLKSRTSLKDLAVFLRQFASLTASGITLLRSLTILEQQIRKPKLKEAVVTVRNEVQNGLPLSTALGRHPNHFPPLMVNMIKAGETGGFLDDALARLAKMYEADADLRAKIKSAMTYPVVVLIFSLLMATGVILFIVPIFEKMFTNLGGSLPLPTQLLVSLSHSMTWVGPLTVVLSFLAFRFHRQAMRSNDAYRLKVDRFKLRLPVFGKLFTKLALSRWSRNLGTLLGVGVPVIQALDVVGGTAGNSVVAAAMKDVRETVRMGGQMSTALENHPLFPLTVTQMVEVGEESGQITDMLERVADYYDKEVETATESLTSAMEPLMVVLLGGVIGGMVICLYLPMFEIYQHIQGGS